MALEFNRHMLYQPHGFREPDNAHGIGHVVKRVGQDGRYRTAVRFGGDNDFLRIVCFIVVLQLRLVPGDPEIKRSFLHKPDLGHFSGIAAFDDGQPVLFSPLGRIASLRRIDRHACIKVVIRQPFKQAFRIIDVEHVFIHADIIAR